MQFCTSVNGKWQDVTGVISDAVRKWDETGGWRRCVNCRGSKEQVLILNVSVAIYVPPPGVFGVCARGRGQINSRRTSVAKAKLCWDIRLVLALSKALTFTPWSETTFYWSLWWNSDPYRWDYQLIRVDVSLLLACSHKSNCTNVYSLVM